MILKTMLLKKKNSDGKFTESLKVEEELIYLIKKLVKDEEILDQITNKLNKQALKDREDYQILNKKISELKYKYPNVRTFLEEKEPIDLRDDEQYAMLNVLDYETELDVIELKESFKLGFKEALIYLNNMGMLKLN